MSVRAEIERQGGYDAERGGHQGALIARMRAVLAAQRALARREPGAHDGLRGALVDLAALCEQLAGDLETADAEYLSPAEAAKMLGVPRGQVGHLIQRGALTPEPRPGGRVAIRRADLDALAR